MEEALMRLADDSASHNVDLSSPALAWKPKAVMTCMVDAFETLRRIPGSVGPKKYGSGWPAIVRELGDYNEGTFEETPEMRLPLSKAQIGRMDEILRWPVRFLADEPMAADALNLWAMCKAWHRSIDGVLQARAKAAADIARRIERETGCAMVLPANCSPDKVISRTSLDRWRYVAAKVIAEGLS